MESRLVLVASSLGCQRVMQAKILVDWNEKRVSMNRIIETRYF